VLSLRQSDRNLSGSLSYRGRSFTLTGTVGTIEIDTMLREAGCPSTVGMAVTQNQQGLTINFFGETGCGSIGGDGLVTK
jgi:hypothetical protein